jgi:hypothetical protein
MSEKRFAGLTVEQLNAAGAAAGADAVSRAHSAGLPSPGMTKLRLASGEELKVLTRLHPDGTLEIADQRVVTNISQRTEATESFSRLTQQFEEEGVKVKKLIFYGGKGGKIVPVYGRDKQTGQFLETSNKGVPITKSRTKAKSG